MTYDDLDLESLRLDVRRLHSALVDLYIAASHYPGHELYEPAMKKAASLLAELGTSELLGGQPFEAIQGPGRYNL